MWKTHSRWHLRKRAEIWKWKIGDPTNQEPTQKWEAVMKNPRHALGSFWEERKADCWGTRKPVWEMFSDQGWGESRLRKLSRSIKLQEHGGDTSMEEKDTSSEEKEKYRARSSHSQEFKRLKWESLSDLSFQGCIQPVRHEWASDSGEDIHMKRQKRGNTDTRKPNFRMEMQ